MKLGVLLLVSVLAAKAARADVTVDAKVAVDVNVHVDGQGDQSPPAGADSSPSATTTTTSTDALTDPHWELALGMTIPMILAGDGPDLVAAIGRQVGPVRIAVDYTRFTRGVDAMGCAVGAQRYGIAARYRTSLDMGIGAFGAYVEAGVGHETFVVEDRPASARSYALGIGFDALFGLGKRAGFDFGYRVQLDATSGDATHLMLMSALLGT